MTVTTSPATALRLPPDLQLTPEQFERVCAENRDAVLELAADGLVITMTPTGSETGARNSELLFQLKLYANRVGGWKVFDSSSGFRLSDGSVFSPDASLVRLDRWQASARQTAVASRLSAPTWWWNSPAPSTKDHGV